MSANTRTRSFALFVCVLVMLSTAGCASHTDETSPPASGRDSQYSIIVADGEGAIVRTISAGAGDTRVQTIGYDRAGAEVWRLPGAWDVSSGRLPAALLTTSRLVTTDLHKLVALGADGKAIELLSGGRAQGIFYDGATATYVDAAFGLRVVRLCPQRCTLSLPSPAGRVMGIATSCSHDGRVFSIAASYANLTMIWFVRVDERERLQILHSVRGRHGNALVSPSGRYAVLLGQKPELLDLVQKRTRQLPLRFASDVQFGFDRFAVVVGGVSTQRPRCRCLLLDYRARILSRSQWLPALVVDIDPSARFLTYMNERDGRARVLRLCDEKQVELGDGCRALAFMSASSLVTITGVGIPAFVSNPLAH